MSPKNHRVACRQKLLAVCSICAWVGIGCANAPAGAEALLDPVPSPNSFEPQTRDAPPYTEWEGATPYVVEIVRQAQDEARAYVSRCRGNPVALDCEHFCEAYRLAGIPERGPDCPGTVVCCESLNDLVCSTPSCDTPRYCGSSSAEADGVTLPPGVDAAQRDAGP